MNKKGFTLVELLAVIVILAIIMIIATMNVGKVITRSRTQSFEETMQLAAKNAKRILDTGDTLTTEKLRQSLGYSANEYDFDIVKVSDGYVLRLISNSTGKFKNVDFDTITKADNYIYEEDVLENGRNIIGLKISTDGNAEKIATGSTEEKIVKEQLENKCSNFTKKEKYELGDIISLCNKNIVYKIGDNYYSGKSEDFYVIKDNGDTVTALAKYRLMVGNTYDFRTEEIKPIDKNVEDYGIQSKEAYGGVGVTPFDYKDETKIDSNEQYIGYWAEVNSSTNYEGNNVYDGNKLLKGYVNNYVDYLHKELNKTSVRGRLLTSDDLSVFGCDLSGGSCKEKLKDYEWMHSENYNPKIELHFWTSIAHSQKGIKYISITEGIHDCNYHVGDVYSIGVRPVIEINKSEL